MGSKGSRVIRGNMIIVPINNAIMYAEPIYLQATQSKLPELKRVILAHNDIVVMEANMEEALIALLGQEIDSLETHVSSYEDLSSQSLLMKIKTRYKN